MKHRPFRLTVLALMILVAMCAIGLGGYRAYERRRECLARAQKHEAIIRSYDAEAGSFMKMAREDEAKAQDSEKRGWRDRDKMFRSFSVAARTHALADGSYARFHERLRNRYLDVARHPWKPVPEETSLPDEELIASLQALANKDPSNATAHEKLGRLWSGMGNYSRALEEYEIAIGLNEHLIAARNESAWILATCPDSRFRNGIKAIALASRACEITEWNEPGELDTLAAAYAEAGQYDSAVEWQAKAVKLLGKSSDDRAEYTKRLQLYQEHKPFRQER